MPSFEGKHYIKESNEQDAQGEILSANGKYLRLIRIQMKIKFYFFQKIDNNSHFILTAKYLTVNSVKFLIATVAK